MQGHHHVNTALFRALTQGAGDEAASSTTPSSFFDRIAQRIADNPEMEKGYQARLKRRLDVLKAASTNILVLGPKGAGKKATLSALFGDHEWPADTPPSSNVTRTQLNSVTFWQADLPEFHDDGKAALQELSALLAERNEQDEPLIDLVMVVLDVAASNVDECYLGLCHTILPMMGDRAQNRLMVAFNKADKVAHAIRGQYVNEPMPLDAEIWLDCTTATLRYRLIHNTGIQISPLAYSAIAGESPSGRPYNLLKLMAGMMKTLPEDKALSLLTLPLSRGDSHWRDHDDSHLYLQKVENICFDAIHLGAHDGDRFGGQLGAFLGRHGRGLGDILCDEIRTELGISI